MDTPQNESKIEKLRHTKLTVYLNGVSSRDLFLNKLKQDFDYPQIRTSFEAKCSIENPETDKYETKTFNIEPWMQEWFEEHGFVVNEEEYEKHDITFETSDSVKIDAWVYPETAEIDGEVVPSIELRISTKIRDTLDTTLHKKKVRSVMTYLTNLGYNVKYVCEESINSSHLCRNGDAKI